MKNNFLEILKILRPVVLLLASMSFLLGIGIAKYLGLPIDEAESIAGGAFILLLVVSSNILNSYFAPDYEYPKNIADLVARNSILRWLFYSALLILATCILIFFFLLVSTHIGQMEIILLLLAVVLSLSISIPPLRLNDRGFGELALALLISGLPIIIGFALQAGSIHRMVSYFSFPLTFLVLVYLLALDFPTYGADLSHQRMTLLMKLTWQSAISVHNVLVLISYLLFMVAPLLGIPFGLVGPALLTLPLAIYQIVMLRNISLGLKPNWRILSLNATALAVLAVYLVMFTFWIR